MLGAEGEPRDVLRAVLADDQDVVLAVASGAGQAVEDGDHRLHGHDHAGLENGVDVLAQLESGLAPVVVGQDAEGVPVAEGPVRQQPVADEDLVELGGDVLGEVSGAGDGSGLAVLWLSPDEFLAVGPDEADTGTSPEAYAAGLADALGSERGQAVDVSANRTTLELSGEQARSVLEKSCEVDLHPRVFPAGTAIATLLGSTGVVLWRTTEDTWRVMPRASFATHVARWLLDGMREYR